MAATERVFKFWQRLAVLFCSALIISLAVSSCRLARPTLHAAEVDRVPRPNRLIEVNSTWANAKPLFVPVRPAGMDASEPALVVTLRAVHDHESLSILAIWDDPTESQDRSTWVWNDTSRQYFRLDTPCDLFAVKFCIEGDERACMMSGGEGVYDVWEWRGGWTHLTGFAEDRVMTITRIPPASGEFARYPLGGFGPGGPEGGDMVFLQWKDDEGTLPYAPVPRPMRRERAVMSAIRAQPAVGSAGDVRAEAVFQGGGWALEFHRPLVTGNADDYQMENRGPHRLSIAVSDNQEGSQHLTSGLIELRLD